jgi:hypothetical protein
MVRQDKAHRRTSTITEISLNIVNVLMTITAIMAKADIKDATMIMMVAVVTNKEAKAVDTSSATKDISKEAKAVDTNNVAVDISDAITIRIAAVIITKDTVMEITKAVDINKEVKEDTSNVAADINNAVADISKGVKEDINNAATDISKEAKAVDTNNAAVDISDAVADITRAAENMVSNKEDQADIIRVA